VAKAVTERFGSAKNAKQALKGGGSSGPLRRLKPDETLKVRFLQEPGDWSRAYYHWLGQDFLWCNKMKSCPGCATGDRAKQIVLANAVVFGSDNDKEMGKVIVMQMAPTLANSLLKFHEKRKTLLDRDYDLTREGAGLDTVYSADPDDPKKRILSRFGLHDYDEVIQAELDGQVIPSSSGNEDDEPRSTKRSVAKKSSRHEEDEDEEDYEDEDEEDEASDDDDPYADMDRSELKSEIRKLDSDFVFKKSQSDDDLRDVFRSLNEGDEEDEEEEEPEDERPPRRTVKKSGGLNEFKKTTSNPGVRTVRRAR
jgi:hypothetical protein